MGILEDRVAVVTGAGNGIGREHALLFASEGAKVVVNDLGGLGDGTGSDPSAAQKVVEEITAAGGEAVANHDDVSDFDAAGRLIGQAVDTYGRLDVLVNNAGILRDAFFHRMTEDEWDAVLRVHLKGHFAPLRHAAAHWKERSKAGEEVRGAAVNTTSASGTYLPNPGQANYGAAKAAIAAFTLVTAAELRRIGVRVNAVAPAARTRLTADVPMIGEMMKAPENPDAFDPFHPKHVAPLVAFLCREDCTVSGKVFAVQGGTIAELEGWSAGATHAHEGDWTQDALVAALGDTVAA
jgi:NAD(P)-dependent dehydrogenase (short-subunit alcohol dehydrogenase family)